jgi:HlyD family secretion protein
LTPRLQERVGELLDVGAVLCTLAEMDRLKVEIAVRESDADVLVRNESSQNLYAALKFHAFPEIDYGARIRKVRSAAEMVEGYRSLVAEGDVEEGPVGRGGLKPGMTGYARIDAGPRSLITVLLRRPYRFFRSLVWL